MLTSVYIIIHCTVCTCTGAVVVLLTQEIALLSTKALVLTYMYMYMPCLVHVHCRFQRSILLLYYCSCYLVCIHCTSRVAEKLFIDMGSCAVAVVWY